MYICFTLRFWLCTFFTIIRNLSPGWENNHTLKCCSGNFPTKPYMSGLLDKYRTNISMYCCSPFQGTRFKNNGKLRDKSVPYFQQESEPFPLDWRTIKHWNVGPVFFQHWYMCLCWKTVGTTIQCMNVLQCRGQDSNSSGNLLMPRSQCGT